MAKKPGQAQYRSLKVFPDLILNLDLGLILSFLVCLENKNKNKIKTKIKKNDLSERYWGQAQYRSLMRKGVMPAKGQTR